MGCEVSRNRKFDVRQEEPLPTSIQFFANCDLGESLGKGSFGRVYALRQTHGDVEEQLAVKVIRLKDSDHAEERQCAAKESDIWREVGEHPNVVKFHGIFLHPMTTFAYLFMELCGPDLGSCLQSVAADEGRFAAALRCVLRALEHVHARQVVHRDVKASNILTSLQDATAFKLCDFGLAAWMPATGRLRGSSGTACYMAPELAADECYGSAVDVWACGVVCYLGLFGHLPYQHPQGRRGSAAFKAAVVEGASPSFRALGDKQPSLQAEQLARALLRREEATRPTAAEALRLGPLPEGFEAAKQSDQGSEAPAKQGDQGSDAASTQAPRSPSSAPGSDGDGSF